ncbi:MAG TPA: LysE family translocator [Candidatus Dormibacteraeota bacterium]|nr:LysE family translocator [Candidatus Dormibacteraeota bacterium]
MSYFAFLLISLIVICTPGQDTALTIRNTLLGGRRSGVATAAGVSSGQAIWTLATSAGLAVILVASGPLFLAIRLAGAAYLVYLGVRSLIRAARRVAPDDHLAHGSGSQLAPRTAYWQGLLSNLSNAKMVAFFVSLLPQFVGPHPGFETLALLGVNFSLLTLAWLVGYAFAIDRMKALLLRSAVQRAMDALLGGVLVGLGLRMTREALAARG